jgi:hypothetical protein
VEHGRGTAGSEREMSMAEKNGFSERQPLSPECGVYLKETLEAGRSLSATALHGLELENGRVRTLPRVDCARLSCAGIPGGRRLGRRSRPS